jgi:hypothetical protein
MSFDARLAKLEGQIADLTEERTADLTRLPFWGRLSDALAVGNFAELLRDWELPRRIAAVLREAERRDDPALRAYAARWLLILWPDGRPDDVGSVEILDDIRARLRLVLIGKSIDPQTTELR